MPTYQYACTNPECGERFERVQAFTDPAVSECPVCGQGVRKVYGSVGVVFKGSGFYRTDSRASSSSAESSSSSSSDSKSGSDSKSDSAGSGKKESSTKSDAASSTSSAKKESTSSSSSTSSAAAS